MLRSKSTRKSSSPYASTRPPRAKKAAAASRTLSVPRSYAATTHGDHGIPTSTASTAPLDSPVVLVPGSRTGPSQPTVSPPEHLSHCVARDTSLTQATGQGITGLVTSVASPTPVPVVSVYDDLGCHVSQSVKDKIWAKEYIDLVKVTKSENLNDIEKDQKFNIIDGQLVMQTKSSTKKITTIEAWTDAFLIFSSIYLSRHPVDMNGILKYIHTIRLGAARNPTGSWLEYDQQFRLKMSKNPNLDWGSVDAELWLLYMTSRPQAPNPTQKLEEVPDSRTQFRRISLPDTPGILEPLKSEVDKLVNASISKNTALTYQNGTHFGSKHLRLQNHNISLTWFGKRGMRWEEIEPEVLRLLGQYKKPDVLMIHCGGNSIGTFSSRHLQKFMKLSIVNIQKMLPQCKIIWSQILPRTYYRYMYCHSAAEKVRKRINSSIKNFVLNRGGAYIYYPDLETCCPRLFSDGTHLTEVGQFCFLNTIQGGLYKIVKNNLTIYP
ncbi:hypothetical protein FSP39_018589 [Pinctada imbricata]|uniref:SGNH hydrolase-type esterase domain-containing protein n=1 Tax=Pinctada imbricata TaxID=66713 RepID=A0AA88XVR8_PINIB|nr:hypothetical protein FSP39_018589 [Pinctada imbricata]